MATYTMEGFDGNTYSVEGDEGASEAEVMAAIEQQLGEQSRAEEQQALWAEANRHDTTALGGGIDSALNRLGTSWDVVTGDLEGVEQSAQEAQTLPKTMPQEAFHTALANKPEGGFLQEVGNILNAVLEEPEGALDETIAQLPNMTPALAGAFAGFKLGAATTNPIVALAGGVGGYFLGATAIEMGEIAQSNIGEDQKFSEEERMKSLTEAPIKGGVITAVDAATFGLNRWLMGAPGRVAGKAISKFLADKGVDVTSAAATKAAITADSVLLNDAMTAGRNAVSSMSKAAGPGGRTIATSSMSRAPAAAAGFGLEVASEGVGEYYGTKLAGRDPSMRDALLESMLSMPQGAIELAVAATGQGVSEPAVKAQVMTRLSELAGGASIPQIMATQKQVIADAKTAEDKRVGDVAKEAIGTLTARGVVTDVDEDIDIDALMASWSDKKEEKVQLEEVGGLPKTPKTPKAPVDESAEEAMVQAILQDEGSLSASTPAAPAQQIPTELSAAKLTELGIPKTAPVHKTLVGKDLRVNAGEITANLTSFANNTATANGKKVVTPEVKKNILDFLEDTYAAPTGTTDTAGAGVSLKDSAPDTGAVPTVPPVSTPAPITEEPAPGSVGEADVVSDDSGVPEGGRERTLDKLAKIRADLAGVGNVNAETQTILDNANAGLAAAEVAMEPEAAVAVPPTTEQVEAAISEATGKPPPVPERDDVAIAEAAAAKKKAADVAKPTVEKPPVETPKKPVAEQVVTKPPEAPAKKPPAAAVTSEPLTRQGESQPVSAKKKTAETEPAPAPEVETEPEVLTTEELADTEKTKKKKKEEPYGQTTEDIKAKKSTAQKWHEEKIRVVGESRTQAARDISITPYMNENSTEDNKVTESDYKSVIEILRKKSKKTKEQPAKKNQASAKVYFNDDRRIIDNLTDIAYDLAYGTSADDMYGPKVSKYTRPNPEKIESGIAEAESIQEDAFRYQKGGSAAYNAAAWVRANLSPTANKTLTEKIENHLKQFIKVLGTDPLNYNPKPTTTAANMESEAKAHVIISKMLENPDLIASEGKTYTDAEREQFQKENEDYVETLANKIAADQGVESKGLSSKDVEAQWRDDLQDVQDLFMDKRAIESTDLPMHPAVRALLNAGELGRALALTAQVSPNKLVRRIASEMEKHIGDTKVKMLKSVKNNSGEEAWGLFRPTTNTILIDSSAETPLHALLHESAHAVLSHAIAKPGFWVKHQLNTIYKDVKDQLSSHYGSESLQDFVAEFMVSSRFRQELASLYAGRKTDRTALRQILDTVIKYFTQLLKIPSSGTFAQLNDMLEGMMSPAPATRGAGELFMMSQQGELDVLIEELKKGNDASLGVLKTRPVETSLDFIKKTAFHDVPKLAKRTVFGFLQSVAFADLHEQSLGIKGGKEQHELFLQLEAAIGNGANDLDGITNKLNNWRKGGKAFKFMAPNSRRVQTEIFNRVLPEMTLYEVDATLTKAQARKQYNKKKMAKWEELQPAMKALEEEGRDLIHNYWDAFKHLKNQLNDNLVETINENVKDKKVRKQLLDKVFKDLLAQANIVPYSPLWRQGDYWLEFIDRENNERGSVYEKYKTPDARNDRWVELKQLEEDTKNDKGGSEVYSIRQYETDDIQNFEKVPPTKFVKDAMAIFDKANVNDETKKMFIDLFISSLPETSFAKSFQQRTGNRGYELDMLGTFQHTAYRLNRQIHQLKYSRKMREQLQVIRDNTDAFKEANPEKLQKRDSASAYMAEWEARTKFALNPDADWIATASRWTNRFAFMWTIGFGPSSALVNTGQLPMVVYPFQAMKTDPITAGKAMMAASRFVLSAGVEHHVELLGSKNHERFTHKSFIAPSGDNYYIRDYATGKISIADEGSIADTGNYYDGKSKLALARKLRPMIEFMSKNAQLDRTVAYDSLGLDLSQVDKNVGEQVSIVSAWMFHTTERLNRQVAMLGAYLNELKRLEKKPTAAEKAMTDSERNDVAMNNAFNDTQYTNGGSVLSTAPRWAQKNVGRIAMMYKSYGILMYTLQAKALYKSMLDSSATKAERVLAMKQFMGINGMVALMSGVQGVTLYGLIAMVANWGLDDDEEDFETLTRKAIGEPMWKGGINQLSKVLGGEGVDVAARIGLSNLIIAHDRYNFDPSWEKSLVKTLGGPTYGSARSIVGGVGDIVQGETQRGIEGMLPAGIRNMVKASTRYPQEGIQTRRGDPIMGDISNGLLAAQFFGFAPAEYTRNQERSQSLKGIDRSVNEQRTKLLRRLYVLQRMNDDTTDVAKDILEFNKKHPHHLIDRKAIAASRKKHMATDLKMYNGILLSPKGDAYLRQLGAGWDRGWQGF